MTYNVRLVRVGTRRLYGVVDPTGEIIRGSFADLRSALQVCEALNGRTAGWHPERLDEKQL